MRVLVWLFRGFVFFSLFAFALNNQQLVSVNWFFGFQSHAPMVFVVLAAFALGCAMGIMAMVPSWWRHRRVIKQQRKAVSAKETSPNPLPSPSVYSGLERPSPDGL
jgi:lipopolysaccharide assembly protein A